MLLWASKFATAKVWGNTYFAGDGTQCAGHNIL